eukprot:CAMPEP_0170470928 /NCGR_PEP_ID=MMETSP0123-20130129/13262_1 /TAXON_ID=182087 /ORGANISM="Favella ehrenbergii, Strain Fehren 1" /LENGTH=65 /DNA_ID=CAMNT_0010738295 /DNA_START=1072 /DNA_END=1269 /DNA_ORIENTATION=-
MNELLVLDKAGLADDIVNSGVSTTHVEDLHALMAQVDVERNKDGFLSAFLRNIALIVDKSPSYDH